MPREFFFSSPSLTDPARTHRLAGVEWGEADNPEIVVCVHGLTRNSRDFDFLAQALASEYRVICPDMPGRGRSEPLANPMDYTYPQYFADLMAMLADRKVGACRWVGTSMGGILGMMMAASQPGKIHKLVLNDIGSVVPKAGLERIVQYAGKPAVFPDKASAEAFLRNIFAPFGIVEEAHWQHMFHHSLVEQTGGFILAYDPAIMTPFKTETKDFTEIRDIDLSAVWQHVACPVLILRGADSDILTADTAQAMIAGRANAKLVDFTAVGHAPALMTADQIGVISDWLKALAYP